MVLWSGSRHLKPPEGRLVVHVCEDRWPFAAVRRMSGVELAETVRHAWTQSVVAGIARATTIDERRLLMNALRDAIRVPGIDMFQWFYHNNGRNQAPLRDSQRALVNLIMFMVSFPYRNTSGATVSSYRDWLRSVLTRYPDGLLRAALAERGITVIPLAWTDFRAELPEERDY